MTLFMTPALHNKGNTVKRFNVRCYGSIETTGELCSQSKTTKKYEDVEMLHALISPASLLVF